MLLLVTFGLIFIITLIIIKNLKPWHIYYKIVAFLNFLSAFLFLSFLGMAILCQIEDARAAAIFKDTYNSLKIENYQNTYINEVEIWNHDLIEYRKNTENPWVNIFYPKEVIEDVDFIIIDLNKEED